MAIIPADEKVFMVDKRTNTVYGGSQALQDMQQWYTMQDVADSVQPYKVFTALLTQSGGDNPDTISGAGSQLDFGQSYYIVDNPDNYDLTIYGAPNNDSGTYFICNDPTNPILTYTISLVLEVNYGAPVATVLENTIGNVWFVFDTNGKYHLKSDNLFVNNKTAKFGGWTDLNFKSYFLVGDGNDSSNAIYLSTGDPSPANSCLQQATIEIRVYN
jgi:hypothetical protein